MVLPHAIHRRLVPGLILAGALASGAGAAEAQGVRRAGYPPADSEAFGYGFADEAVRGTYIGAPLTRFPSPDRIVPAPWSYGTYGIPTLSGLRPAPVAAPSVTVIDARATPARRSVGPHVMSRDAGSGWSRVEPSSPDLSGVNVVAVRVPRR